MTRSDVSMGKIDKDLRCFATEWGGLRVVKLGEPYNRYEPWSRRHESDWTIHKFDVKRSDQEHWSQIRRFIFWLGDGMGDWSRISFKTLRRGHFAAQAKEWDEVLPREIVAWANEVLRKASADFDCCDNWRCARVGNTSQVRRYKAQKANGCCGSNDCVYTGPDGRRYMLGFNFGH